MQDPVRQALRRVTQDEPPTMADVLQLQQQAQSTLTDDNTNHTQEHL